MSFMCRVQRPGASLRLELITWSRACGIEKHTLSSETRKKCCIFEKEKQRYHRTIAQVLPAISQDYCCKHACMHGPGKIFLRGVYVKTRKMKLKMEWTLKTRDELSSTVAMPRMLQVSVLSFRASTLFGIYTGDRFSGKAEEGIKAIEREKVTRDGWFRCTNLTCMS